MMRLPRIATLGAIVLGLAALPAFGQERPWLHVSVEDGDDNTRVEVNLPFAAVEALGDSLAGRIVAEIEMEWDHETDMDVDADDLRALWKSLRDNPGAWVTLEEEDGGNLRARMDGDEIRIEGAGDDGALDVRLPVAFGDALFGEGDEEPDLAAAIRALADHDDVLVSVGGDEGRVRVSIGPR